MAPAQKEPLVKAAPSYYENIINIPKCRTRDFDAWQKSQVGVRNMASVFHCYKRRPDIRHTM